MSLDRFRLAQADRTSGFENALRELEHGRKRSHWIWYIFPQLVGLGSSHMARQYGIKDLAEARAYLRDPVLRERLQRATKVVLHQLENGVSLTTLMGGELDAQKLVSSLTLYEFAARSGDDADHAAPNDLHELCSKILSRAESAGFPRCAFTLAQINAESA